MKKKRKFEVVVEYEDDVTVFLILKLGSKEVKRVEFDCFDNLFIDLYEVTHQWYDEFKMDGMEDELKVNISFDWF